jgi:hypothetical protein
MTGSLRIIAALALACVSAPAFAHGPGGMSHGGSMSQGSISQGSMNHGSLNHGSMNHGDLDRHDDRRGNRGLVIVNLRRHHHDIWYTGDDYVKRLERELARLQLLAQEDLARGDIRGFHIVELRIVEIKRQLGLV